MKILFADYETGLLAGRKHEEEVLKKNQTPMPWSLHFSKSMMKS